jgi:MerR family transcriptional regulator, light-induced transcriptional regulator
MDEKKFGQQIKYFRKQAGLTQGELGEKLGVSQVTIAHYERGNRYPQQKKLNLLSRTLGVPLEDLLSQDGESIDSFRDYRKEELLDLLLYHSLEQSWHYVRGWKGAAQYSTQEFFIHVLIPLMEGVGHLWQEKEILISQEHRVTEKVKILVDRITREELERSYPVEKGKKRWMGLCAPSEQHDLVLFMCSQIMKLKGWEVNYIGREVPLGDLKQMIKQYKPHMLLFSLTMRENQNGLGAYLENLLPLTDKIDFMVGGKGWDDSLKGAYGTRVKFIRRLEDYEREIEKEA